MAEHAREPITDSRVLREDPPRTDYVTVRALGPGVYEGDRLLLPSEDGKRVVVVRLRDVPWLVDALTEFRVDCQLSGVSGVLDSSTAPPLRLPDGVNHPELKAARVLLHELIKPDNGSCNLCGARWYYDLDGTWDYNAGEHYPHCIAADYYDEQWKSRVPRAARAPSRAHPEQEGK